MPGACGYKLSRTRCALPSVPRPRVSPVAQLSLDRSPRRVIPGLRQPVAFRMGATMRRILTSVTTLLLSCLVLSSVFAAPILLRTGAVEPPVKSSFRSQSLQSKEAYYLIQFAGPIQDAWKEQVLKLGIKLGDYVPEYAFVARMNAVQTKNVVALECVSWVERVRPEYRRDSALAASGSGQLEVAIKLFAGESPSEVEAFVKNAGGRILSDARESDRYLRASLPSSALAGLTSLEGIEWVEEWVQPRPSNDVAQGIIGVHDVRQRIGLYGEGQIIAFADSGLDTGNFATLSGDFGGRILAAYALRRQDDWSDLTGHGTHAIGVATGAGLLSGSNPAAHSYDTSFAGVAPESQIVIQSIGDSSGFVYPPMTLSTLFQPTYDLGARVHSDSWGSPVRGKYTFYSQQVDDFINTHRDFIAVFPMGNDGRDGNGDGVTDLGGAYAPATAKNCIAVGATENVRSDGWNTRYGDAWPTDFPAAPLRYDHISDNAEGMVSWSCRGPCEDQRIKPDICAPGTNIVSTRSHGLAGAPGWRVYDDNYVFWGGTSMSTPMVAGAAVLVREYYVKSHGISPSSALVKATLLNGATDLSPGQHISPMEVPPRPNNVEGWGRVNVAAMLDPPAPKVLEFVDEGAGLSTGQSRVFEYNVLGNSVPLAVTLVWTDPPSSSLSGKQLVNDLDLRVLTPGGQTLMGNGTIDITNNVESVDIPSPAPGVYRITVSGRNVPSGPQSFALVISGELPGAYVSGTVTTPTGKPISGVTMTLADGGVIYTTMTGQNGEYTIHLPADSYIAIPSKDGWTFDPISRLISVGESGTPGVDFTGTAPAGHISGTVTRAVGGRTNYSLDSDHPYADNTDVTYTIAAHPSVTKIRVHFDEVDLQNGYDFIYVEDVNGVHVEEITGEISDHWTPWITGNVAKIRLVSDNATNRYGFHIDGYDADVIQQGPLAGVTVRAEPGNITAVTQTDGSFTIPDLEPVAYKLTPVLPHWKFSPDRRSVTVMPGATVTDQSFLAFPPGTVSGMVSTGTTSEIAEVVESAHPYLENSLEIYEVVAPEGCSRLRVHFSDIEMEPGFDFVDVLDADDNIVDTYTGSHTDVWSSWVVGNRLKIRLESDESFSLYGFRMDKYMAVSGEQGVAGVTVTSEPSGFTAVTDANGAFTMTDMDAGRYFLSAAKPYWIMEPASRSANVVAGVNTPGIDFYGSLTSMPGISYTKSLQDGEWVCFTGKAVTAGSDEFSGCFYIEESDRFAGIKVTTSQTVHAGDLVAVTGTIHTSGAERYIAATHVGVTPGAGLVPDPLGITGYMMGGRPMNIHTPGVKDGVGLNNIGLLVRCWGRVANAGTGSFILMDGSISGGVKVICEGIAPPADDTFVEVTGISTCEQVGSDFVRVLRVRRWSDIVPVTTAP